MLSASFDNADPLAQQFRSYLAGPGFPCLGAKSAIAREEVQIMVAEDIGSSTDDFRIYAALCDFVGHYKAGSALFQSFVVLFRSSSILNEWQYEAALWNRLQSLTDQDCGHGHRHDARVSSDPANPRFSLSFADEAFYVVGLHPGASRPARRFERAAIAFNPHDQFEKLRGRKLYDRLREKTARRDEMLAGSRNPMLQSFGEASEARQYSGRAVEHSWQCPFHRR